MTIALYLAGAICSLRGSALAGPLEALGLHALGVSPCMRRASFSTRSPRRSCCCRSSSTGSPAPRGVAPWCRGSAAVVVGLLALAYVKANLARQRRIALGRTYRHARDHRRRGTSTCLRPLGIQDGPQRMPTIATLAIAARVRVPSPSMLPVGGRGAGTTPPLAAHREAPASWRSGRRTRSSFPATFYYSAQLRTRDRQSRERCRGARVSRSSSTRWLVLLALLVVRALRLRCGRGGRPPPSPSRARSMLLAALRVMRSTTDRRSSTNAPRSCNEKRWLS